MWACIPPAIGVSVLRLGDATSLQPNTNVTTRQALVLPSYVVLMWHYECFPFIFSKNLSLICPGLIYINIYNDQEEDLLLQSRVNLNVIQRVLISLHKYFAVRVLNKSPLFDLNPRRHVQRVDLKSYWSHVPVSLFYFRRHFIWNLVWFITCHSLKSV